MSGETEACAGTGPVWGPTVRWQSWAWKLGVLHPTPMTRLSPEGTVSPTRVPTVLQNPGSAPGPVPELLRERGDPDPALWSRQVRGGDTRGPGPAGVGQLSILTSGCRCFSGGRTAP